MDVVDKAKELEVLQRESALKLAKQKLKQKGRKHCLDCEEPIPAARRKAYPAANRCIHCQATYEGQR